MSDETVGSQFHGSGPLWDAFVRWSRYACSPGNGHGHLVRNRRLLSITKTAGAKARRRLPQKTSRIGSPARQHRRLLMICAQRWCMP